MQEGSSQSSASPPTGQKPKTVVLKKDRRARLATSGLVRSLGSGVWPTPFSDFTTRLQWCFRNKEMFVYPRIPCFRPLDALSRRPLAPPAAHCLNRSVRDAADWLCPRTATAFARAASVARLNVSATFSRLRNRRTPQKRVQPAWGSAACLPGIATLLGALCPKEGAPCWRSTRRVTWDPTEIAPRASPQLGGLLGSLFVAPNGASARPHAGDQFLLISLQCI